MQKLLPEQFIIYRPRDIVSGDYYWITEKNNKVILMIADCTGHGVPGAFMSMLGVAYLNEIVSKYENLTTDLILNELRKQVIHSLHQTGKEGESQDGMDVSLCIIDKDSLELQFSGANNPIMIFRKEEMIELRADKMPIGIHTVLDQPFTRKELQLQKGDMLYAFSDGYPDQFGGPQGKKFMIRNFKKLLSHIHALDVSEQKAMLEKTLDDWMADYSQIDDILVMGVRV
jgi:serine phosphatase RsbU (regulator of sigma subunit)